MERVPRKIVVMNENGGGDMIMSRPVIDSPSVNSPSLTPTPTSLISELLARLITEQLSLDEDEEGDDRRPGRPRAPAVKI